LRSISANTSTREFDSYLRRGFAFYKDHFIGDDGVVRYFHDRAYPVDTHCVAQSIITLLVFRDLAPNSAGLARSVFRWAMNHMWDEAGYFYYRRSRFGTIRTSYMRWAQAWMFLALSMLSSADHETAVTAKWGVSIEA
jgi:hypothetical protein